MNKDEMRKIIQDDIDWMFNVFDIERLKVSKSLRDDWDYILKIKLGRSLAFEKLSQPPNIEELLWWITPEGKAVIVEEETS